VLGPTRASPQPEQIAETLAIGGSSSPRHEQHTTPAGTVQPIRWAVLRRK